MIDYSWSGITILAHETITNLCQIQADYQAHIDEHIDFLSRIKHDYEMLLINPNYLLLQHFQYDLNLALGNFIPGVYHNQCALVAAKFNVIVDEFYQHIGE